MQLSRRGLLALLPALPGAPAFAHHGWRWTDKNEFELTGVITETRLNDPRGILTVEADGQNWEARLGQQWRGLTGLDEDRLSPGTEITLRGQRDADPGLQGIDADTVLLDGNTYDLAAMAA